MVPKFPGRRCGTRSKDSRWGSGKPYWKRLRLATQQNRSDSPDLAATLVIDNPTTQFYSAPVKPICRVNTGVVEISPVRYPSTHRRRINGQSQFESVNRGDGSD